MYNNALGSRIVRGKKERSAVDTPLIGNSGILSKEITMIASSYGTGMRQEFLSYSKGFNMLGTPLLSLSSCYKFPPQRSNNAIV